MKDVNQPAGLPGESCVECGKPLRGISVSCIINGKRLGPLCSAMCQDDAAERELRVECKPDDTLLHKKVTL